MRGALRHLTGGRKRDFKKEEEGLWLLTCGIGWRTTAHRPGRRTSESDLEGLKKLAGLSWLEMAELLGVTDRGALKWRRGGRPSAANLLAIMELARGVPGGHELMLYGDAGAEEQGRREEEV